MGQHGLPLGAASIAACFALGAAGCGGCTRSVPEPGGQDAGPSTSAAAAAGSVPSPVAAWLARHPRDDAGHLIPQSSPPPDDPALLPPKPGRDPDWDLDREDPARDYVRRYTFGTGRYGPTLDCVDVGASKEAGDRRRVEVKTAASCAGAGTLRDVFLVDVAADRLSVDDKAKRDPLAHWPDGSDPEGPPSQVRDASDMHVWKGSLRDVIREQQLVAIRIQAYGRGTYPVVTLAGWHGAAKPGASPEDLRGLTDALCRAGSGMPLGLVAGIDRSMMLRIRCPGGAFWDRL
jgi:hypothetical protein